MNIGLAAACLAAAGVALLVALLVSRIAPRLGLIDKPNPRGSHARDTPRGGGLGVVAGAASGVAVLVAWRMPPSGQLWVVLLGALVIAALGAVDDMRPLGAGVRLMLHILIASAVSTSLGGLSRLPLPPPLDLHTGPAAIPLGVLWLVTVTNFFNFMDGIDGLAGGQTVASCAGIVLAGWSAGASQFAAILGSSTLGFMALNIPPAKVFLGDVGSTSIGFSLAGLALVAGPAQRPAAVLAVTVGLGLFILDPIDTLIRLARRGHPLGVAHRQHNYQLLARAVQSHGKVSAAIAGTGLVLAIIGAIAFRAPALSWGAVAATLAAFLLERYLASRAAATHPAEPG